MTHVFKPEHKPQIMAKSLLGWSLGFCLTLLGVGCAKRPDFSYERTPGVDLEHLKRIALDPREDIIWTFEGQRVVAIPEYQQAVIKELLAKGYVFVEPEQADFWLDVIGLTPRPEKIGARRGMGGGRGRGAGRGKSDHGGSPTPAPDLSAFAQDGQAAPRPLPTLPTYTGGELSVVVELLKREDQSSVWFGSAHFPVPEKGNAPTLGDTPSGRVKQLMQPL